MALLQGNQVRPYDRKGVPDYVHKPYPRHLVPPGGDPMTDFVVVNDEHEEAAQKAMWNVGNGEAIAGYPKWMFHPTKPPVMVRSKAEEDAHGRGWYPTPSEAVAAAGGAPVPVPVAVPQMTTVLMTADEHSAYLQNKAAPSTAPPIPMGGQHSIVAAPRAPAPDFDHQAEGAVLNAAGPQAIEPPGEGFHSWDDDGDGGAPATDEPAKRKPGRPPKAK